MGAICRTLRLRQHPADCRMYISMMGADGLRQATETALLNANYVAGSSPPIIRCSIPAKTAAWPHRPSSLRPLRAESGITEVDIAKRLMDYGFHAPTMSFPVAGTLMIEPTESESKAELDRFIAAMKQIKQGSAESTARRMAERRQPAGQHRIPPPM